MFLRNRILSGVLGLLALAGLVSLIPAVGGASTGSAGSAESSSPSSVCTQAKSLAVQEDLAVAPYLSKAGLKDYQALTSRMVDEACGGRGANATAASPVCAALTDTINALRAARAGLVPPAVEAQLRAAEDSLLQLACSS